MAKSKFHTPPYAKFMRHLFQIHDYKDYLQNIEYKKEINDKFGFVQVVEFRIIRKLRNYILHYSLLDIGVFSNWNRETGKSKHTFLSPVKLLAWNKWNDEEKRYLESKGERLNVEPIIYRYYEKFLKTQNILFLKVAKTYKDEIEILITKVKELSLKGIKFNMTNTLPFRKSTLRYLKYLLKEI